MNPVHRPPRAAPLLTGALALALGSALVATPAARAADECTEAVPQSCANCCKLPCIEAEILKAKYQQDFYRQMAKRKNLTQEAYETEEKAMGTAAEAIRVASLDGLETCNYYVPRKSQCYAEQSHFRNAGFRVRTDDAGRVLGTSYNVTTDIENCVANADAMALIPAVSACEGIGRATIAHENKHVADCEARRDAKKPMHLTPNQIAAGEVAGYDAELAALDDVRLEAALDCKQRSCDDAKQPWDKNAEQLGYLINDIVAKGPAKAPSKSPLARPAKGKKP